jgi:hypothetical protein
LQADQLAFAAALESRDLIGQTKGVIVATMHCDGDGARPTVVDRSDRRGGKRSCGLADVRAGQRSPRERDWLGDRWHVGPAGQSHELPATSLGLEPMAALGSQLGEVPVSVHQAASAGAGAVWV